MTTAYLVLIHLWCGGPDTFQTETTANTCLVESMNCVEWLKPKSEAEVKEKCLIGH